MNFFKLLLVATLTISNISGFCQDVNNENIIILFDGDTIRDVSINTTIKRSNENFVTIVNNDQITKKIRPEEASIVSYKKGILLSKTITERNGKFQKKFVKQVVGADISFYYSINRSNKRSFYLENKSKDSALISLEMYEFDVENFFSCHLPEYKEFRKFNNDRVRYEYKSLADHISKYNHFINPEKYVVVKHKKERKFGLGAKVALSSQILLMALLL